jgi:hypothetical protein
VVSVAGRIVADTREALTLRAAAYPLEIELLGDLAGILALSSVSKKPVTRTGTGCK